MAAWQPQSPPIRQKPTYWRPDVDEDAIIDEILVKEIQERTQRDDVRQTAVKLPSTAVLAGYSPHRPLLKKSDEPQGSPKKLSTWGSYLEAAHSRIPLHPLPICGHWPVAVEGMDAAELGLSCELYLATDGTCTLVTSCWGVHGDDDSASAKLLCSGRWDFEAWSPLCGLCKCCLGTSLPCVPEVFPKSFAHSTVRITLEHGSESGLGKAQLPLRWSKLPGTLFGTLRYADDKAEEGQPQVDGEEEHLLLLDVSIGGREWSFRRAKPPRWQDRCELAGLSPTRSRSPSPTQHLKEGQRGRTAGRSPTPSSPGSRGSPKARAGSPTRAAAGREPEPEAQQMCVVQ